MKLAYFCPIPYGGIHAYAVRQAEALQAQGIEVTFLTSAKHTCPTTVRVDAVLEDEALEQVPGRVRRGVTRVLAFRRNCLRLRDWVVAHRARHVLMASYSEYGAPFWSGVLRPLKTAGVRFGAILHDPIRSYSVGPPRFHQFSVSQGYSYLSDVFVHEPVGREEAKIPESVDITVIPFGPLLLEEPRDGAAHEWRRQLRIPSSAKVILSFGQVRDGKNLDLLIEALPHHPDLWLLVAGKEAGGNQKSIRYYQELSRVHGVSERCRWIEGYIAPKDVGGVFLASDLVLLTYGSDFRSASGVLNAAVQFRRPCLASSGAGPLRTQVERYRLGAFISPNDTGAIIQGLAAWKRGLDTPDWAGYEAENSWAVNVRLVIEKLSRPEK